MARFVPFAALVAVAVTALALTGCASSSSGAASTPSATPAALTQQGRLVGVWTIQEKFESPEHPFVAFAQDNTWIASDGCNRVQGTWQLNDLGDLTTTSGPSTQMACDGAQIPLTVAMADHASVNGDYLTIDSSQNTTTTTLVRSTDPTVGPQGWPIGYWTETRTPTSPFLSLAADRTFSGSDGCNRLTGTWTPNGNPTDESVTFSAVASTMMACPGVDTWLSRAASATARSGVLTVLDADGAVLGQLKGL